MDTIPDKKPLIRFEKNFVIEENIDTVQWPQECEVCGGRVEFEDTFNLKEKFKNFGEIRIDVTGIPYCNECLVKAQRGARVNQIHTFLTVLIGIPLGILFLVMAFTDKDMDFVWCGGLLLLALAMGYGIAWLLYKLPAKLLLKNKMVEPVRAWLITEKKRDKKEGISVVISIPNKIYASKFAQLNQVPYKG